MPKVAVVIPARFASTRLPGKPLIPLAGKPLIQHVWERCSRARGIETVIVATDDLRIAAAAEAFGARVAMTSAKHRSGTDRVAEAAGRLRGISHVINVQGDEPLVDPRLVAKLAATMIEDRSISMITAASRFDSYEDALNPNAVKAVLDRQGNALYFSRSPIPHLRADGQTAGWWRHLGIYGYTTKFLLQFVQWKPSPLELSESLEQLRALENGARIRVLPTPHPGAGVDTPADLAAIERLLAPSGIRKAPRRRA